ncbi:G-type lectin S-receptor-like serine/threonine-protein kinase At4g27290 [Pistacia vera]|uniref:G-type lectin S-receptor-like serine/threonine-protein kinase At4g27290 n=1 Tax=Pistacia vera TaxID=55513 RepID=UPI0012636D5F|nr:G-type lectin S-receptor-like serine/threonine-protein kinase At4g27290 [Pistacia vera]
MEFSSAADTITPGQPIRDGETLISSSQRFELGFFSPGNSNNRYLGIWYYTISPKAVVWVANRNIPIADKSGVLTVLNGNLVILNQDKRIIWSSNSSRLPENPVAKLLDSGNFILREDIDTFENYMWQSFDYPSDTLLTGMKLGWNLKTDFQRTMTAWRSASDPAPGNFTLRLEKNDGPELVISTPSKKVARSGPWNGFQFNGIPMMHNLIFKPDLVHNEDESYYMYDVFSDTVVTRLILDPSGSIQRLIGTRGTENGIVCTLGYDICDHYAECGANGNCRIGKTGMSGRVLEELCMQRFLESGYRGKGSGCLMWFGDLTDMKECSEGFTGDRIFLYEFQLQN